VPARKIEWTRARKALGILVADPERTDQVFEIVRALSGRTDIRSFKRLLRHDDGFALLADRPDLLAVLSDRAAFAKLPEGSLGRAYLAFMQEADLTADGLVDASMQGGLEAREGFSIEATWFFDRLRDMHDLWHVLTGYGRDEAGEAANLAFTLGQLGNPGIGLIVLAAAVLGPRTDRFEWQRYLFSAWRRGRRAAWLPAVRYENILAEPLAEVRARLGIAPPEVAHPAGVIVANRDDLTPEEGMRLSRALGQALPSR
ncbi:MAG: Coq4 family protein, partial [Candidatus Binatia bacterium]